MEDHHFIRIDAKKESGDFFVYVEDNGEGMSPAQLASLRKKLDTRQMDDKEEFLPMHQRSGIGLINVHRRIQMVFGEQYGLIVESEAGRGTTITMHMPAEPKKTQVE